MSLQHCALSTSASTWQSKKHKCYKCIYQYQHDNQKSTSAVNAYINTKAFHIQPPTVWLCTDTHMHTPTQWRTHTPPHTYTPPPPPHTHTCIHNTVFSHNTEIQTTLYLHSARFLAGLIGLSTGGSHVTAYTAPSLSSFPNVAFETVPVLVYSSVSLADTSPHVSLQCRLLTVALLCVPLLKVIYLACAHC